MTSRRWLPALRVAPLLWCGVGAPAYALTLTLRSTTSPESGITLKEYRTSSPSANVWVAEVDLCADGIHLDARRAPSSTQSTASWGAEVGAALAINGDFYKTGPVRVYGDATGGGVPWPEEQTGLDSSYSSEWYYGDFGWIAFRPEGATFTHTGWVKDNLGLSGGWDPATRRPSQPDQVVALVSGFPALVNEGVQVTCSSPTASSCFPDRSDMRDRHPRTAIGLSADMETLYLAVVDGRTSSSSGMYGAELADLMFQVGAWQAFNLDGGGSAQMWVDGEGYVNDVVGNNSGSSARSVANHLGVFVGPPTGSSARPWHCPSRPPCAEIPPGGDTLDEAGDCFQALGNVDTWRPVADGHGGSLIWTNKFTASAPDNWAWWRLHLQEPGEYLVEFHGVDGYSIADDVRHVVRAAGVDHVVVADHSGGEGWHALGTFSFAAGGDQYVAFYDDATGSVPSGQRIALDALRLTRVGPWCGDGACDPSEGCAACPGDCPPVDEILDNGVDDDCDGETDEAPPVVDSGDPAPDPADSGPADPAPGGEDGGATADSGAPGPAGGAAPGERAAPKGGCAHGGSALPPGVGGAAAAGALALGLLRRRRRTG